MMQFYRMQRKMHAASNDNTNNNDARIAVIK